MDGDLHAFAECRLVTGDGCLPDNVTMNGGRDICTRKSTDSGQTWGPLTVVVHNASQNTPVFDSGRGTIVLNFNTANGSNAQTVSADRGSTWGPIKLLAPFLGALDGASAGPGVALQLSAGNPHHPGRLLAIGHRGAYVRTSGGSRTTAARRTPSPRPPRAARSRSWTRRSSSS